MTDRQQMDAKHTPTTYTNDIATNKQPTSQQEL